MVTGQCAASYSAAGGHRYTSNVMVDVYNLPSSAQGGDVHAPRAYAMVAPWGVNLSNGSRVDIDVTGSSGTGSQTNGQLTRFSVGVFYRTPTNSVAELPTQSVFAPARSSCGKTATSYLGSPPGSVSAPVVGMAVTPKGNGYWEVTADAHVYSFGGAAAIAAPGTRQFTFFPNRPIVGMAATPDGHGYWLVGSDGGVFTFGDAHFYGSTGAIHLNKPIVGMAATPDGGGYWLVASDGGVFTFGDAHFYGSMGGVRLNRPVVGMAVDDATGGYWMVASDGGVFSFDAPFHGSTGNMQAQSAHRRHGGGGQRLGVPVRGLGWRGVLLQPALLRIDGEHPAEQAGDGDGGLGRRLLAGRPGRRHLQLRRTLLRQHRLSHSG